MPELAKKLGFWRFTRIGRITGFCTIVSYSLVNVLDYLLVELWNHVVSSKDWRAVQCVRLFPFEGYGRNSGNTMTGPPGLTTEEQIVNKHRDLWDAPKLWFPASIQILPDLNIAVCPFRLWYSILITWLTLWTMLYYFRKKQSADVQEIVQKRIVMREKEGDRSDTANRAVDWARAIGGYETLPQSGL
jgi:hypothetical protein